MVAPMFGPVTSTYCTASRVVMCSITTLRSGNRSTSGPSVISRKAFSRSKMSISGAVTSPWMSRGMPSSCIFSSVWKQRDRRVTPASECVVAPAG